MHIIIFADVPGASPRGLHPDQTPQPPRGGARPVPVPQIGNITCHVHRSLRGEPRLTQRGLHLEAQHLLAQGAEIGHQLLLIDPHCHPGYPVLPAPRPPSELPTTEAGRPSSRLLPTWY